MKKRIILLGIILIVLIFSRCNQTDSYEKVINNYVSATFNGNAKEMLSLIHDDYVDVFLKYGAYQNKSEMIKEMQYNLDTTMERMNNKYGKGWDYEYYITDAYIYSQSDIDFVVNYIGYEFAEVYYRADEVMEVVIDVIRFGDKGTDSSTVSIILMKIDGRWYTTMETY